jgi:hypothetical protein
MGRIHAKVASDLFEVNAVNLACQQAKLTQPALKAQVPHPAPFKALGLEVHKPMVQ